MGNCGQKSLGTREERDRNKKIDSSLKAQKREVETVIRILLLGAGESGKSTFAKQMRILFLEGFDETECQRFKGIIHNNVIISLQALLSKSDLIVPYPTHPRQRHAKSLASHWRSNIDKSR